MLEVTDAAIKEFKNLLAEAGVEGHGVRVSISDGGGCGPSYGLDITAKGEPGDTLIEKDGLKVFIEPMAHIELFDATIECVDSGDTKRFAITGLSSGCCG